MEVDIKILNDICRYCEDKAIYDKLSAYNDFYYKIKKMLNNVPKESNNPKEEFNNYIKWLITCPFNNEILDNLGYEIGRTMAYFYVNNEYEDYDEETDTYVTKHIDTVNINVQEFVELAIDTVKNDDDLLVSYGITKKKKPTKKCPCLFTDIDWDIFNKF